MILQDKLDAYKSEFVKKVPPEALAVMHRATEDLASSGIMESCVKAGAKAPDFTLNNQDGEPVTLGDHLKEGSVVLGFYRGRW
jgi:hypothetical protein